MIIVNHNGKPVVLAGAGQYTFTYKGEKYEARQSHTNGKWTVGTWVSSTVFEPMVTRHNLNVAVNAALDDVDQIDSLMGGQS